MGRDLCVNCSTGMSRDLCVYCRQPFTRKDKGWNRFRVARITSENTWTTVFGKPALYKPSSFICRTCYKFLVSNTRPAKSTRGLNKKRSLVRILKAGNPRPKREAKATAKPNPANDGADVPEERTDNDTLATAPAEPETEVPEEGSEDDTLATPPAETDVPEEIIEDDVEEIMEDDVEEISEDDVEEIIEDDVEEIIEDNTSATPPANTDVPEESTEGDTPPAESAIQLPELHYSKDVSTVGPPPKNWQWVLVPVLRPCDPKKATPPQRSVEGHTRTKGQKKKSQIQGPVLHAPVSGGDKAPQEKNKGASSSTAATAQKKKYLLVGPLPHGPDQGSDRARQKKRVSFTISAREILKRYDSPNLLPHGPVSGGDKVPQGTTKRKPTLPTILSPKRRKQSVMTQRTLPRAPDTDGGKAPSTLPLVKRWTSQMKQNSASNTGGDKAPQENTKSDSTTTPSARRRKQVLTPGGGKNALESRGLTTPSRLLKNGEDANLERSIPFSSSLPNEHSEDDEVVYRPLPQPKSMKETAIDYIEASKYRLAFKKLCEESPQAKKALLAVAQEMIRKEVKAMRSKEHKSRYSQPFSMGNVKDFRWDELVDETEKDMPITFGCISAILPSTERIKEHMGRLKGKIGAKRDMTDKEAQAYLNRRLGQMVAIGLFTNRPRIFKFVQTCMGFELWRQGASTKVFRMLNHSGITLCIATATAYVESLTENHDEKLKEWKKTFEVTLGIIPTNPGTTQGIETVLEHLQQYLPASVRGGGANPTLVSGNESAIKGVLQAQRVRADRETWQERLDGYIPVPQEYDKEILFLQDSNNVFFDGKSASAKGTIAQLKNEFNYNFLRKEVLQNVQEAWDMYEFVTEGYSLLCALKFCGTSSLHEVPASFPATGSRHDKLLWVKTVAQRVVDFVYHEPKRSSIQLAANAYSDNTDNEREAAVLCCRCRAVKDEEMIVCCNAMCPTPWYHLSCAKLTAAPEDDWFCCNKCLKSPSYTYCLCKRKEDARGGTRMVQCAQQENCRGHEWYHYGCIGLQDTDVLPEKWYCGEECALDAENDDHVLNHSRALTLEGLRHLARQAAVRTGNGPVMVEDWKIDLLSFWSRRHPDYLANAHYFLACVGGFAPKNIIQSLIWNRVVNINGRRKGNFGMDYVSKQISRDYKGTVKSYYGKVTDKHAEQLAKVSGPCGHVLGEMFSGDGPASILKTPCRKRAEILYKKDVESFVHGNQGSALFSYLPCREHRGFEEFDGREVLRDPQKLGHKLKALSRRLDTLRRGER
ncbi:uncharacterized protein [Diadema setosum]|uniref:uncharacterized protein isoform X2 n=1 Tax=Diadema setosum TaxID=31175 RepID=UPI003B3B4091